MSRAHAAELTMIAFDASHEIACDVEAIRGATREQWRDMLQPNHFALAHEIASWAPEPFAAAATRVRCAWETLHGKFGTACAEISLASRPYNDWIVLSTERYHVHCEYDEELQGFDRVLIWMRLARRTETTLRLLFDYFRVDEAGHEHHVARGAQEIASMTLSGGLTPIPRELVQALKCFETENPYGDAVLPRVISETAHRAATRPDHVMHVDITRVIGANAASGHHQCKSAMSRT